MNICARIPLDNLDPGDDGTLNIEDLARSRLPAHDAAVAQAEALCAKFRAIADWNAPGTFKQWEEIERDRYHAVKNRDYCRTLACWEDPDRTVAAYMSRPVVRFESDRRRS